MNSSTHHDRTVTIDVQIPLGATEDLDESIPADIYPDWLQERLNEALSDLSATPDHPGVLGVDVDAITVTEVTRHESGPAYCRV
ncbi:hypothetical protein [Halobellus clavatus]|uniref:Uncharacterized protein n=1 Tax=Halobellus clavatus TaxID=660517 RepID=A0A1H3KTS5_9EURY|nr:hypothetical protein [Halobellus clavatus]SDY55583.1 hypothetical protein SAMN04487946_12229 [Halobellus clavatus]